jgi:hypothetical protein
MHNWPSALVAITLIVAIGFVIWLVDGHPGVP